MSTIETGAKPTGTGTVRRSGSSLDIPAVTMPQLYRERALARGDRVAHVAHRDGDWREMTWTELVERTDAIARSLVTLGVEPGDVVSILSHSRAEWVQSDMGIMTAGAITVPIYPSNTDEQCAYILSDAGAKVLVTENAEQTAKVLPVLDETPVERVVQVEGDLPGDAGDETLTYAAFLEEGSEVPADAIEERLASREPDDVATIVYTSGTTGVPKGVVQTHRNHVASIVNLAAEVEVRDDDVDLLFLPLSHSFARAEEFAHLYEGFTVWFAREIDTLKEDLQVAHPTVLFSVPRVYEKFYDKIMQKRETLEGLKASMFDWAVATGREVSARLQEGEPLGLWLGVKYWLARKLALDKVGEALGGEIRYCVSGGAALSKPIAEFFHAAGVLVLEGYGLTETCPVLAVNRPEDFRFGTVGKPIRGVEIKIAEDGEILGRGPNVFREYYGKPDKTDEVFTDEWFHTGDVGTFDEDGFLKITGRKKHLFKTSGGKYIAPNHLEALIKDDPHVSHAMIVGADRRFCTAVIAIDEEAVGRWAAEQGIGWDDYADLASKEEVHALVRAHIDEMNEDLPSYETIKYFVLARRDFTPESGELTPTMKVKRRVVEERYADEIDELYDRKKPPEKAEEAPA